MRKNGKYPEPLDKEITQILAWINNWTNPISFTVAVPGGEVAVSHGLGFVPAAAIQCVTEDVTGDGVISPGPTGWTTLVAYLTATVAGDYAVIFRR